MLRHSGGILTVNKGPVLEVKAKPQKHSLQFHVTTSDGLSSRLGGILGVNMSSAMFTVNDVQENIIMSSNQQRIKGKIDKLITSTIILAIYLA